MTKLELGLSEAQHKLTSHELLAAQAAEARQLLVSTRKQRGEAVQHTVAEAEGSRQQTLRRLVTLEQERALSEARARMAAEASAAAERAQLASTAAQGEARRLQAAAQQAAQAAQAAAMQASSGAAGGSLGLIDGGGPSALPAANGFGLEGCGVGASGEPVLLCTLHPTHLLCTLSAPSLHRLCAPLHRLGPFAPPGSLCTASVRPLHPPRYRPATAPLPPRYRPAPPAPPLQGCADIFGSLNMVEGGAGGPPRTAAGLMGLVELGSGVGGEMGAGVGGGGGAGESLHSLLLRVGLERLLPTFVQNEVTQVAELRLLTDADFKEMSILIGSRRKLMDALGTGGGVALGQGGVGGGLGVAPASTPDSFLAGLASPPAAMAATATGLPPMEGAAGGGGGGGGGSDMYMFGAPSSSGGGAVAPAQPADMFGALSIAGCAGADAADVPPTPPSSVSAFGFLGGGGERTGQSPTAAAAARPSGARMLDPGVFADSDKLMTSVPSCHPRCTSELQPHCTPAKSQPTPRTHKGWPSPSASHSHPHPHPRSRPRPRPTRCPTVRWRRW